MPTPSRIYHGADLIYEGGASAWSAPVDLGTARTSSSDAAVKAVTVATSATAHTKGAWVEVIASTAADADLLRLIVGGTVISGAASLALADIGIGAAASETVLVANVQCGNASGLIGDWTVIDIPVHVPAGSRLSVRWQSQRASAAAASFAIGLHQLPSASPTSVDTLGADTATSGGVNISPPGNHVQITASTGQAYRAIVATLGCADTSMVAGEIALDIGVGASSSEVLHYGPSFYANTNERMWSQPHGSALIPVSIPAGSRVTARVTDDSGGNGPFHCVLLGIPA